jgi:hypothetical protein
MVNMLIIVIETPNGCWDAQMDDVWFAVGMKGRDSLETINRLLGRFW